MSTYTYTQRFVKISDYLLLEYNYTNLPTPEEYYVNIGNPAVGFEKIVNGHFNNAVQILNDPTATDLTYNVRNYSVVEVEKNRFVTLSNDYLYPYLDKDPDLTNEANLPIVFPSNINVYYDTIKFHIVSGYNFENLDGIILRINFQERTGKKATVGQMLVTKSDLDLIQFNANPIYLGGALYDNYVEVKIPAYANMTYEFDTLSGSPAQADTLAAKISSDGNGFLRDAPIEFLLYEINQTVLKDGYENYIAQIRNQLSITPRDSYTSLVANITENTDYFYLEYYPTWDGNFLEDFINAEGKVGNAYYVVNEIELKEQVGLAYFTTYNLSTIQTQDFNAPYIFRPVLANPLTTSFVVNYTMRLVNKNNQNQIIRRASFNSYNVSRYGRENNIITLTTGAYAQKVYNKITQAPSVLSPYSVVPGTTTITERKVPVFYKDTNISITQESVVVDKNGNVVAETSSPDSVRLYGQGKASILVDPFDNFYKFTIYNVKGGTTPEILDLGTSLTYYLIFLDSSGQSVRVENIKNLTSISNPTKGQLSFKLVSSNSTKVLGFKSRDFYVISKTPDGVESKLYSGTWKNKSEYDASTASKAATAATGGTGGTGTVTTTTTTTATGTTGTTTSVKTTNTTGTATTTTGNQVVSGAPVTKPEVNVTPYKIGSSSILSVIPKIDLIKSATGINNIKQIPASKSIQTNVINITALSDSIAGREAQGQSVQKVVNYYFTPGSPGADIFKGIKTSQFLTAALNIHPKLANGSFDPKYVQYCNAFNIPATDNPSAIK